MIQELFQQARLIDPTQGRDETGDLLVEDGVIVAISPKSGSAAPGLEVPAEAIVHDCRGLIIAPGLVDLYSQCGDPGHEDRETLASLTAAAAAGGFSRVALLPNTQPEIDNVAQLSQQLSFQPQPNQTQLYHWAALTQGAQGKAMTELQELNSAGALGFCDGNPITDVGLVRRLLEYLNPLQRPIALWARDQALAGSGIAREGSIALQLGLPGDPETSETMALASLIEAVRTSGTPVHAMRISTARGIDLIRQAKAERIPITASVTWLHLLFNSQDLQSYDPCLRLTPPLGNPKDQQALIEAVNNGIIDAIAIDHSPYNYEEKTVPFGVAPAGAIGLELALSMLWQRFVVSGQWSPLKLWEQLSSHPAECLSQRSPSLEVGQQEWLLFDPQYSWRAEPQSLQSQASNSPFLGQPIIGKVKRLQSDLA